MDALLGTRAEVPADAPSVAYERRVAAAPESVWKAWTTPDLIARWWGPNGCVTTVHEMDVRPGGLFRFTMHAPDGADYPNRIAYRAVETARRLAYRHDGDIDNDPRAFEVEVTFTRDRDGTIVRMHSVFPSMEAREAIKAFDAIELGKQTMEKMAAFVEGRTMTRRGMLTMQTLGERELVFTRDFNAPPDMVFDAWTKPDLLERWLYGPDGWFMAECRVDLRVGGTYRFVWGARDGDQRMGMGGTYEAIERPHRLVTTELFDEDWTGGETLVTLLIGERSDGGAHTEMTVLYSSAAARAGAVSTPMAEGMEQGYARLDILFEEDGAGEQAIG